METLAWLEKWLPYLFPVERAILWAVACHGDGCTVRWHELWKEANPISVLVEESGGCDFDMPDEIYFRDDPDLLPSSRAWPDRMTEPAVVRQLEELGAIRTETVKGAAGKTRVGFRIWLNLGSVPQGIEAGAMNHQTEELNER